MLTYCLRFTLSQPAQNTHFHENVDRGFSSQCLPLAAAKRNYVIILHST